jgi:hypothetical protein
MYGSEQAIIRTNRETITNPFITIRILIGRRERGLERIRKIILTN